MSHVKPRFGGVSCVGTNVAKLMADITDMKGKDTWQQTLRT